MLQDPGAARAIRDRVHLHAVFHPTRTVPADHTTHVHAPVLVPALVPEAAEPDAPLRTSITPE